ncbi:ATP-binding protein [Kitasatospora indigofera]|uniref:ATP-binding protein n=1 Tax=Kitasatospora indigofera TaxID=67307 RepID=UPI003650A71F
MYCLPSTPAHCYDDAAGSCRIAVFCVAATSEMAHLVRTWTTRLLSTWSLPTDDPITVVAELVANAAEHGGADMNVRLHHCSDTLQIEVVDTGSATALPEVVGHAVWGEAEGLRGRGLPMVTVLSEHVLLRREPDGSTRALALMSVSCRTEPSKAPRPRADARTAPESQEGAQSPRLTYA